MLMILTNITSPRLLPRPDIFPLHPYHQIPHEPRMPFILMIIQQIIRPLPRKQVHHQLPHLIAILRPKDLENNPGIRRRRYAVRFLRQFCHLVHYRILATLNVEFVDHAIEVQEPEVGWFCRFDCIHGFVVEGTGVEPVEEVVKDVGAVFGELDHLREALGECAV